MIHLLINALAASAGGGLTYVRNVVPHLGARGDVTCTVLLDGRLQRELGKWPNLTLIEQDHVPRMVGRLWLEQRLVRELLRSRGANVLLSTGNFALWNSPVPQILLSRNSLYTSCDFETDLRNRGEYRLWLDTRLKGIYAKWSVQAVDSVVAPSASFADELQAWTGRSVVHIHHGFDRNAFVRDQSPLCPAVQDKLDSARDSLRLLFVSHYNYYRNFETLIRALPLIRRKLGQRKVRLLLTCELSPGANPGSYRPDLTAALVRELGLSEEVVELGAVSYAHLHYVYRAANIYVTPAYAESFAHPLVEAMSTGIPVVASDLRVHREICGPAALYFQRFSPPELAERVVELATSPQLVARIIQAGVERSTTFSWRDHVDRVLSLARGLVFAAN